MLSAETIALLHRHAACWYQENGFAAEDVNHFLTAQDFESVASLVEQTARTLISTGGFEGASEEAHFAPLWNLCSDKYSNNTAVFFHPVRDVFS